MRKGADLPGHMEWSGTCLTRERYGRTMNKSLAGLLIGVLALPAWADAQTAVSWDPQGLQMERPDLMALLEDREAVATSSAYSGRIRDGARRDVALITERLTVGDFRSGDQIELTFVSEPALSGQYLVEGGPRISLPGLAPIPLQGVLRSELETHLTQELSRYFRNPVVRARSEIRVSVQGAVGNPGFHTAPGDMLFSQLIQAVAGGPGGNANLEEIRVERGVGERIWEGEEIQMVLSEGRTLDQMNLRGGDQVIVPERSTNPIWGQVLRWGLAVGTSVAFGVRLFF